MRIGFLLVLLSILQVPVNAQDTPKFEIGTQYSALRIPSDRAGCLGCMVFNHGFGARFVANLNRAIAIDSEFDFFPAEGSGATNVLGGRVTTTFLGVKAGYRTKRFGIFGKLRPGLQTYGRALNSVSPTLQFGSRKNFALDVGGVAEYYPSRRIAFRFDVGDTRIHFDSGDFGHFWGNNLQITSGILFRF